MIGNNIELEEARLHNLRKYRDSPIVKVNKENTLSYFGALNILVNLVCSTDPYFQSESTASGLILFTLIGISICILTYLSFYVFSNSWQFGSGFSYTEIWVRLFGPTFAFLPNLLVLLCYLSMFIAFSWELYEDAYLTILTIYPEAPEWTTNIWFCGYAGIFILLLITTPKKKLADFTVYSIISNICMVIYFIVMAYIMICSLMDNGYNTDARIVLFSDDMESSKSAFATLVQCFFLHPIAHHIIIRLQKPTLKQTFSLTRITIIVTFIFNIGCGLMSYIAMPPSEMNPIFQYEGEVNYWVILIGRIASITRSYLSASGFLHLVSYEVSELVFTGGSNTHVGLSIGCLAIALLVQMFNVSDEWIFDTLDMIGTVCFLLLTFVLPPAYYFKTQGLSSKPMTFLGVLLIFLGVAVVVFMFAV